MARQRRENSAAAHSRGARHNPNPKGNADSLAHDGREHAGHKVYSAREVEEHLAFVESTMLTPGFSETSAVAACRAKFGFAKMRYATLKRRVQAKWAEQDERDRPSLRASAVRRIMSMLNQARGQQDRRTSPSGVAEMVWTRQPNHMAVARYEALLADIQGTRAPIEVNVHHEVSSALTGVIGDLSPEQLQDCLDEWRETQSLAEEARAARLPQAAAE